MSEYQYYEFQAIDQPLGEKQMAALQDISTRAVITATSFTNTYNWGDLKADPARLLRKYFDAFLYVANWGTHWLAFRVPADAVDIDALGAYETSESLTVRSQGTRVILDFRSEDESGDWNVAGEGWLASLVSLRADILCGDFRALYLAWLLDVQRGLIEEGAEPPVPPGLAELSAPLKSLADFLRLDDDLLIAAAEASVPLPEPTGESSQQWQSWIQSLDEADKDAFLRRAASGDAGVQWEMRKRFRKHLDHVKPRSAANLRRRSVGDILAAKDERACHSRRREAEKKARRQRKQAAARNAYLDALVQREDSVRRKIGVPIKTTQQKNYDQAVQLLIDLRDAAALHNSAAAFGEYLAGLRDKHARKATLLRRFASAGL